MTKTTEIIVAPQQDQLAQINAFFGDIDFNKLNDTISQLANRQKLTKVEKTSALEIIDSWNTNIIGKLDIEKDSITQFINALYGVGRQNGISDLISSQAHIDELELLIDYIGANEQYDTLIDTMDQYAVVSGVLQNQPRLVIDLESTKAEEIIQYKDLQLEQIKVDAECKRLGNKIARLNTEIAKMLVADKDVQTLIRGLKKKATAMNKMKTECTDKAQLAKINVTIDDNNVRDALKDLINFKI